MRIFYRLLLFIPAFLAATAVSSQTYILNGSATQNSCNCYTLTPELNTQSGSVWNASKINLSSPFDFWFRVYLGTLDASGADGIVFILQPLSTSVGTTGEGMGFGGVTPSIGIALDTWQNTNLNDPAYDHISIQANGNISHLADLAGPVPVSATSDNIEDGQWHRLRISWDPATQWLRTYFDDVLRVETQVDLINTIFSGDPMVYWGFSGATGGAFNLQQFCTALEPMFSTNFTNNNTCVDSAVIFSNESQSFAPIAAYYWDFGDGNTSTLQDPPPHIYSLPGSYMVKFVVTGLDGCQSDTLQQIINVGAAPVANFAVFDTCFRYTPRLENYSNTLFTSTQWLLDGLPYSNLYEPALTGLSAEVHNLQLVMNSQFGCGIDTLRSTFEIKGLPVIESLVTDGCVDIPLAFTGNQLNNAIFIQEWHWDFGDNTTGTMQYAVHTYTQAGNYTVLLWADATNGCTSDTARATVVIRSATAHAGPDTLVAQNSPFQLQGSGGNIYSWAPATGLDDPSLPNPTGVLQDDQVFILTVTSADGCQDTDSVRITVFKGSAIYIPNAFTPNRDGLNDILRPMYIGISKISFFRIYNRWGELVFNTKDMGKGWDGTHKGADQGTGTFVWILEAEDLVGKPFRLKGTVTVIR